MRDEIDVGDDDGESRETGATRIELRTEPNQLLTCYKQRTGIVVSRGHHWGYLAQKCFADHSSTPFRFALFFSFFFFFWPSVPQHVLPASVQLCMNSLYVAWETRH